MNKLLKYKNSLHKPLKQATLCFLVKDKQVLLAMKKRGFGKGKWNGVGGKRSDLDKNINETALRETFEEIAVKPTISDRVAMLNFIFIGKQEYNLQVTVFIVHKWDGEPEETEEMAPQWFNSTDIPYDNMWEDDKYWLPLVLEAKKIEADFLFDENEILIEHEIKKVNDFEK